MRLCTEPGLRGELGRIVELVDEDEAVLAERELERPKVLEMVW